MPGCRESVSRGKIKIKGYSNVALGGDGGDETFFGYITFDAYYLALRLKRIFPNFFLSILKR